MTELKTSEVRVKTILNIVPKKVEEVAVDPYDNTNDQKLINGYGDWGHVVNKTTRSILNDLGQYPLPDDIKNTADVIYNKMTYRVRRGKIRFQMLFFCVYCAYLELKRNINPIQLGKMFGLTPGEVQRCDSIFSPLQTNYQPPRNNTSPLQYLPDYCEQMQIADTALAGVVALGASILKKDPSLTQENPQTVAAGILRYYIVTNGIMTDDASLISKVTGRSSVTIEGIYRKIAQIDNA